MESWSNFRQVRRLPQPTDQAISWKGFPTTFDTSSPDSRVPVAIAAVVVSIGAAGGLGSTQELGYLFFEYVLDQILHPVSEPMFESDAHEPVST